MVSFEATSSAFALEKDVSNTKEVINDFVLMTIFLGGGDFRFANLRFLFESNKNFKGKAIHILREKIAYSIDIQSIFIIFTLMK